MKATLPGYTGKIEKLIVACSEAAKSKPFDPVSDACALDEETTVKSIARLWSREHEGFMNSPTYSFETNELHEECGQFKTSYPT